MPNKISTEEYIRRVQEIKEQEIRQLEPNEKEHKKLVWAALIITSLWVICAIVKYLFFNSNFVNRPDVGDLMIFLSLFFVVCPAVCMMVVDMSMNDTNRMYLFNNPYCRDLSTTKFRNK